ncbi:hypothetical protein HN873_028247, partial [Arachis hypogaea]
NLVNLKEVDLAECRELIELPDFSKAYTLESVDLSYCRSLRHVHQTILSLGTLGYLNLHNCKKIKALESEIHLRSLQQLHVEGCSSLRKFSLSLEVESLNFSSRVKLSHLSVGCLSKVKDIGVVSKQTLHIIFDGLQYLLQLTLLDCHGLFELPDNINCLSSLQILELDGSAIERLPESIKHLSRLETLSLWNCKRLQCLPELPLSIINLKAFNCSLVQMTKGSSVTFELTQPLDRYFSFLLCVVLSLITTSDAKYLQIRYNCGRYSKGNTFPDSFVIMEEDWDFHHVFMSFIQDSILDHIKQQRVNQSSIKKRKRKHNQSISYGCNPKITLEFFTCCTLGNVNNWFIQECGIYPLSTQNVRLELED